jgi:hypothetical protein
MEPQIVIRPAAGGYTRRTFIVCGTLAAVAAVSTGPIGAAAAAAASPSTTPGGDGLHWRGVNLDTERGLWRPDFIGIELASIANDLHANAVLVLGSDLERLIDTAAMAAERGLFVWLEPRHFDSNASDTLAFVLEVATAAEALRTNYPHVGLSMGVELTLFMDGLLPGDDWLERGGALASADPEEYNTALNGFLTYAVETVRPIFGGELTYSSGPWERVDWSSFDVVGVDLYRDANNRANYVDDLRAYFEPGKPVIVTEFGCCTFDGAADLGGEGFMRAMDGDLTGLVRDEHEQATEIAELLDIAAEGVRGAFIYNFIEPDNTYSSDPSADLDMTGFSLVKCHAPGTDKAYDVSGYFEPKLSFEQAAIRYARSG